MNVFIATRNQVNDSSQKFTVSGVSKTDTLMLGIRDGDTIYVTDIGPAGQDDVEDDRKASQHGAIYWSTEFNQVVSQLELI